MCIRTQSGSAAVGHCVICSPIFKRFVATVAARMYAMLRYHEGNAGFQEGIADPGQLWEDIKDLVILALLPAVSEAHPDPHCFEVHSHFVLFVQWDYCEPFSCVAVQLLGFDVLLDQQCKPWIIEINSSPSTAAPTKVDELVKVPMLRDALAVLGFPTESLEEVIVSKHFFCLPALGNNILPFSQAALRAAHISAAHPSTTPAVLGHGILRLLKPVCLLKIPLYR